MIKCFVLMFGCLHDHLKSLPHQLPCGFVAFFAFYSTDGYSRLLYTISKKIGRVGIGCGLPGSYITAICDIS